MLSVSILRGFERLIPRGNVKFRCPESLSPAFPRVRERRLLTFQTTHYNPFYRLVAFQRWSYKTTILGGFFQIIWSLSKVDQILLYKKTKKSTGLNACQSNPASAMQKYTIPNFYKPLFQIEGMCEAINIKVIH